ncbi:type IV secretory pathway TrbF-like protein [Roseospira visakhapatnamensis]|uniref:Type IV secretory pathway TrbF-like protein n=2 Tax=Roseospira visakhapatnamensis TaxID=390880 RepID=A0A7W6RGQ0_9PROT|nr:type IV secretory pathway TrbF-like protein [Roseospira visakhapatnamensis]
MTDPAFWKRYRADHLATEAMARALADGATRDIHVETVTRLEGVNDDHKLVVDFTQIDRRRGQETGRKPLRAYLSMETRPQEVHPEDRYSNPLGIFVRTMVLKERE